MEEQLASATDQEAFNVTKIMGSKRILAFPLNPATVAVAFAGFIKMVRQGKNSPPMMSSCLTVQATFPPKKSILGDDWAKQVDFVRILATARQLPETGIISALQKMLVFESQAGAYH